MEQGDNEVQKKQQISRGIKQNNILKNGALSVAESGWGKEAFCIAEKISGISERNEVFADIASIQVGLGNFVQAFNIIKNIEYNYYKEKVKVKVVERLIRLGKIEQAERVLGLIKGNSFNYDNVYHCEVPLRDINNENKFTFGEMICAWKKLDQETKDEVKDNVVCFSKRLRMVDDIKDCSAENDDDLGLGKIVTDKKCEELKPSDPSHYPNIVALRPKKKFCTFNNTRKDESNTIKFPQKISEKFNEIVFNEKGLSKERIELLRQVVKALGINSLENGGYINTPKITPDNAGVMMDNISFVLEDKFFKNKLSSCVRNEIRLMLSDASDKLVNVKLLLYRIEVFEKFKKELKSCKKVTEGNAEHLRNIASSVVREINLKEITTFISLKDTKKIEDILNKANRILLNEAINILKTISFNGGRKIDILKITSKNCERINYAISRLVDESFLKEVRVSFSPVDIKEMKRVLKILNKN